METDSIDAYSDSVPAYGIKKRSRVHNALLLSLDIR